MSGYHVIMLTYPNRYSRFLKFSDKTIIFALETWGLSITVIAYVLKSVATDIEVKQ